MLGKNILFIYRKAVQSKNNRNMSNSGFIKSSTQVFIQKYILLNTAMVAHLHAF